MSTEQSTQQTPSQHPTLDGPVPHIWPGAFSAYAYSRAAVMYNIGTFLGLIGLNILVSIASSLVSGDRTVSFDSENAFRSSGAASIINIITQLASIWISAAMAYLMIAGIKRRKTELSESLREAGTVFLPFLGVNILVGLISVASILLLVVPAFFIIPRLVLAQYYLIEGKMGVTESISASWNATKGNTGKVWGLFGVGMLLVLLAVTIVGIPFAIYFGLMYQAAVPLLYMYLKGQLSVQAASGPTAPTGPTPPTA